MGAKQITKRPYRRGEVEQAITLIDFDLRFPPRQPAATRLENLGLGVRKKWRSLIVEVSSWGIRGGTDGMDCASRSSPRQLEDLMFTPGLTLTSLGGARPSFTHKGEGGPREVQALLTFLRGTPLEK